MSRQFQGDAYGGRSRRHHRKSDKRRLTCGKHARLPIADGGEGTLECFRRALTGRLISVRTRNSNFRPCTAEYLLSPVCAIVESAKAIGLASTEFKNPAKTTSYGVGVIIDDALMRTKDIVLALGGSSTNDGGAGIAAALGVKFFDKSGETFIPTGGTLKNIEKST